ncbi:DUF6443 domain-containing protein [Chitinophaga flava]|nr:DUF6443 domain-containing protein [Chitinophaga flava]
MSKVHAQVPLPYNSTSKINYVRTLEPSFPTTDPAAVTAPGRPVSDVKQATKYFDGLGRLLQTVEKGMSGDSKDIVTPVLYDEFGLEQFKYLPYVPTGGNMSDGKFKLDPFGAQQIFYKDPSLNPTLKDEGIYYHQTEFEPSPLNRTIKVYAPGSSWGKTMGNKPVGQQYLMNTAADSVRIWTIADNADLPVTAAIFDAGQLYKNVTTNEHNVQTVEYKDKEGRMVLKKVQLHSSALLGTAHMGWLCTYYVYDNLNRLRFVISPMGVSKITSSWNVTTVAEEFCFRYRYDTKSRMIFKKVPGAKPVEMVYDQRNRLVFTRDGNMNADNVKNWLVTFYDELNRPVQTALYHSAASRETLQGAMNTVVNATGNTNYKFPGIADLVVAAKDRDIYKAINSIAFESGFDTGENGVMDAYIDGNLNEGIANIVVNNPLPDIDPASLTPLTYTFYDHYDFPGSQPILTTDLGKPVAGNNPYSEPSVVSDVTTGLVTGTKARILGTDRWQTSTIYYNSKGRVVQTVTDNIANGKDITSNLYDFNGKLLSTYGRHKNPMSSITPEVRILTMMDYDQAGRVLAIRKQINDAGALKTIVQHTYNALGQLTQKQLGDNLDVLTYDYNIRGWLLGMNRDFVKSSGNTPFFGFELGYDKPTSVISGATFAGQQYSGNVSGTIWRSKGDNICRKYDFSYDLVNRLSAADFNQQNSGSSGWSKDQADFSVSNLSYDASGNILTMRQKGISGGAPTTIDDLRYDYKNGSTNKLNFVTDGIFNPQSTLGDFKENQQADTQDYWYDDNGNMTRDENKNIGAITYNHLNLPEAITMTGKGNIRYYYNALGKKVRKVVQDNSGSSSITTTTDYINGFVYKDNVLQFTGHEEGRIRAVTSQNAPVAFVYDYFEKDHLGNVRIVLTEQNTNAIYAATMETATAPKESALFSNLDDTRVPKPVGFAAGDSKENKFVAKLNAQGSSKKIGPSIVLRVMAGDTVQIGAKAFYKSTDPANKKENPVQAESIVTDLIAAFGGTAIADATHGGPATSSQSPFNTNFYNNDYQRLKDKDPDHNTTGRPKAYLNFVLFDDQFKLVEQSSGVKQVKAEPDQVQTLSQDKMPIAKTGFLYVYTSNESPQDVFFDDVVVAHASSPLLEETHYYPFGLTMAGISSSAQVGTNYPENRFKYNGNALQSKEFIDGTGLELYDFNARSLDHQIGRFWQTDPLMELHLNYTPYNFALNNPILFADPLGLDTTRGTTIPESPKDGDVLAIPGRNGGESFYSYSNNGGWVGTGMNGGTLNEVTVGVSSTYSNYFNAKVYYGSISDGEGIGAQDMINFGVSTLGLGINMFQTRMNNDLKTLIRGGLRTPAARGTRTALVRSLKSLDKVGKRLGWVGAGLTAVNLANKYVMDGEGLTRKDLFDAAISVTLAVVSISNPIGLVGLGVYGFLDATGALDNIKAYVGIDDTVVLPSKPEYTLHNLLQ